MLYSIEKNLCHYLLSFACNKFLKMRVTIRRRTRRNPLNSAYQSMIVDFGGAESP